MSNTGYLDTVPEEGRRVLRPLATLRRMEDHSDDMLPAANTVVLVVRNQALSVSVRRQTSVSL